MKLTLESLDAPEALQAAGVDTPSFNVRELQAEGVRTPRWLHIGPGNLFRVFIARLAQQAIEDGAVWPISTVIPMSPVEKYEQLGRNDLLTLGVTLHADGRKDMKVIAPLAECLATREDADYARFMELATKATLSLLTFTVTEKGYAIHDSAGNLQPAVVEAIEAEPRSYHSHTMALVASFLLARYESGAAPLTLISFDNFSHNGDKLRDSVLTIARGWAERGAVPAGFIDYLSDDSQVAFPISVIDKITPRPAQSVADELAARGFEDMDIRTPERTPLAGFVNTEAPEYLIIEKHFATQMPPLEDYGVKYVERHVCDEFERMKVTTCLNPLHTALAVSGCLLRMPTIDSEMRDPDLAAMVNRLAWDEGMPVVTDPGIIDPKDFVREVLEERFPNPYLPDDPARIAMDTSQKLPIRFGETIKSYLSEGMDLEKLHVIPLVFALWCRYLMGVDDAGNELTLAPDPLAGELSAHLAGVTLGASDVDLHSALEPILSNAAIFGVNLYETPLGKTVEGLFARLIAGPGAVRATIHEEMNK